MSGCDDSDNMIMSITGAGKESIISYESFRYTIENPKLLITDQSWGFTALAKKLNCKLEQIPTFSYQTSNGFDINTLNQIHAELKGQLSKYHGVSLKHLQGCLDMFCVRKMFRYRYSYESIILNMYSLAIKSFSTYKNFDITTLPFPFDVNLVFMANFSIF